MNLNKPNLNRMQNDNTLNKKGPPLPLMSLVLDTTSSNNYQDACDRDRANFSRRVADSNQTLQSLMSIPVSNNFFLDYEVNNLSFSAPDSIQTNIIYDEIDAEFNERIKNKPDYNPKIEGLSKYKGVYPYKAITTVRKYLINRLKPIPETTHQFEEDFELLKLKLNIKSRFDDDPQMWRRMKNETKSIKKKLNDHIQSYNESVRSSQFSYLDNNDYIRF